MDGYSREVFAYIVTALIFGQQVGRYLSELIELRGKPSSIVCNNRPEYTSKAMFFWSQETGFYAACDLCKTDSIIWKSNRPIGTNLGVYWSNKNRQIFSSNPQAIS